MIVVGTGNDPDKDQLSQIATDQDLVYMVPHIDAPSAVRDHILARIESVGRCFLIVLLLLLLLMMLMIEMTLVMMMWLFLMIMIMIRMRMRMGIVIYSGFIWFILVFTYT